jgi:hypothetical protein
MPWPATNGGHAFILPDRGVTILVVVGMVESDIPQMTGDWTVAFARFGLFGKSEGR